MRNSTSYFSTSFLVHYEQFENFDFLFSSKISFEKKKPRWPLIINIFPTKRLNRERFFHFRGEERTVPSSNFGDFRFLKSFYRELGTRDPPHLPGWASPLPLGTLCPAHFQPHLQLLHKGEQEHRLENIKPDQIFAPVRVSVVNHPAETATWSRAGTRS